MENTAEQNKANDYKVVSFHNSESFDFTHEMGCMYDGRPVTGLAREVNGIASGESKLLPYHVGMQLAKNLAKQTMLKRAAGSTQKDENGNPMVRAIWDDAALDALRASYVTEMYSEDKPAPQSATDILFERISKLEALLGEKEEKPAAPAPAVEPEAPLQAPADAATATVSKAEVVLKYKDKQEVIKELEARNIPHNKRDSQEKLEKLLA